MYHCNIHHKDVVKHPKVGHKFNYVLLPLSPCVLIQKYLHVAGLDLGLGVLTSTSVLTSAFWPRLTPLRRITLLTETSALTPADVTRCARRTQIMMKKHSERRKLCEPKFPHAPATDPGAQDRQNLISWRWSLPAPTDPVW